MMLSLCAVNEIKLLAFYSFFVIAFLAGPATGLALTWSHNRVQQLRGLVVGFAAGALAVVVLVHMVDTGARFRCPVNPIDILLPAGRTFPGT